MISQKNQIVTNLCVAYLVIVPIILIILIINLFFIKKEIQPFRNNKIINFDENSQLKIFVENTIDKKFETKLISYLSTYIEAKEDIIVYSNQLKELDQKVETLNNTIKMLNRKIIEINKQAGKKE